MQYTRLGNTELTVSKLCLGTMTFGEQTPEPEAHDQLEAAFDHGVNFFDTAELYPSPPRADTQGRTEQYIGNWLKASGRRDRVIIATKAVGRSKLPWLRDWEGGTRLDARNIEAAVEGSLRRLQTDYIDLFQLHWPERRTNIFGRLGYTPSPDQGAIELAETLAVLDRLVRQGKIRHIGVCNETPWGLMKYLALAQQHGLPRMACIQNPYSLLDRTLEIGLAEVAHREQIGVMAASPLAMGMLTGKYLDDRQPEGARLTEYKHFQRYMQPRGLQAAEAYVALAREHGLEPAQMAIAYVVSQPLISSAIIGASRPEQLRQNLAGGDLTLSSAVLEEIEAIHQRIPNPCP